MIKPLSLGIGLISLLSTPVFGCSQDGSEGIFPKNKMRIPVGASMALGTTQEEFNAVISLVEKTYLPEYTRRGWKLVINRRWTDPTVNANASLDGNVATINMYGGLARHPEMTMDAFAMVVCHEMGHHLAGSPLYGEGAGSPDWAATEGQSDYFATLKCARFVWATDSTPPEVAVDPAAKEGCSKSWSKTQDRLICERSSMAGKALAETLRSLNNEDTVTYPNPTRFDTPDSKVVKKTYEGHPAPQCRLDTYFEGAVCTASKNDPVSSTDATIGTCSSEKGMKVGNRPLCWYKPKSGPGPTPPTPPKPEPKPSPEDPVVGWPSIRNKKVVKPVVTTRNLTSKTARR